MVNLIDNACTITMNGKVVGSYGFEEAIATK